MIQPIAAFLVLNNDDAALGVVCSCFRRSRIKNQTGTVDKNSNESTIRLIVL